MKHIIEDIYLTEIAAIAKKLNTEIYLVGGAIRDALLKRQTNDYDFVVFGDIEGLAKAVAHLFGCKTVKYNKKLLTYRVFCKIKTLDFSAPRGKNIQEDLKFRDFTINSIAFDLNSNTLIDPLGAKEDLRKGIIKANSPNSIKEDPLRILRGFRLAALFRFDIDPRTILLFRKHVELLNRVSKERITQELKLFFNLNETFTYLLIMDKVGIIDTLFEDLSFTNGCIQSNYHLFDVKTHSLSVYNYIEWAYNRLARILGKAHKKYLPHLTTEKERLFCSLKLAALFHDAAKPFCKVVTPEGKIQFPLHAEQSYELFEKYAKAYSFGKKIIKLTRFFIKNHIKPAYLYQAWSNSELTELQKVDFFLRYKEYGIDLLFFALADTLAKGKISASKRDVYIMFLQEMADYFYKHIQPKFKTKPLIEAKEILTLYPSLEKSKLKHILFEIKKLQIAKAINTKEEAGKLLKHLV
ncbi:HD domain-containing protein [Hippea maritima]|uniref:Polynucleotide adenylyltransferase region n=1 Tax=Hippea maritima (strain ATCC 700847 / DSM 10411 / MH2) TaxID=760142 RepID=F2LY28_HIPMA|nr:HD domain-containing protein [Hippea maritima]AEA33293.1 Polynucleotide adenylyltransferase region [Hippea maritima DSM 10411]